MDGGIVVGVVGDVLVAGTVILATVELRRSHERAAQSRQDLIDERRVSFYLEQLVAISRALGDFGKEAPYEMKLRLRLLPDDMVPAARDWASEVDPRDTSLWKGDFTRDLDAALAAGASGLNWGDWIRERVRLEIDVAVESLLPQEAARRSGSIRPPGRSRL